MCMRVEMLRLPVARDVAGVAVTSADRQANVYFAVMWAIAALAVWRIRPGRAPSKVLEGAPRWGRGLRQRAWLFVALMAYAGGSFISTFVSLFRAHDASVLVMRTTSLAFSGSLIAVLFRLRGWPEPEEAGK